MLAAAFGLLIASNVLGAWQWKRLLQRGGHPYSVLEGLRLLPRRPVLQQFPARQHRRRHRASRPTPRATAPPRATAFSTVLMDRLVGTVALAGLALVTTLPAIDRFHLATGLPRAGRLLRVQRHRDAGRCSIPACLPALERLLARIGLASLKPHLDELAARLADFRDQRGLIFGWSRSRWSSRSRASACTCWWRVRSGSPSRTPTSSFSCPLLAVIVSLPISLNGIGVREGAGMVLFGLVGVGRAPAFCPAVHDLSRGGGGEPARGRGVPGPNSPSAGGLEPETEDDLMVLGQRVTPALAALVFLGASLVYLITLTPPCRSGTRANSSPSRTFSASRTRPERRSTCCSAASPRWCRGRRWRSA